jgi:hypothetical protein
MNYTKIHLFFLSSMTGIILMMILNLVQHNLQYPKNELERGVMFLIKKKLLIYHD